MSPAPADLLIRDGAVIDGTGKAPLSADVAIKDGRIACVEPRWPGTADRVLEAAGLWVAPGFIDIHSHSDFTLLADPRAMSSIAQGVTLEVVGNCGHGCAPLVDPTTAWMNVYGYAADYPIDWRSVGQYLERLQERRPAVNVLTLVPNGRLRLAVAGLVDRPSTPDELRRMKELLQASLEEGAFGFSTGLEYGPERACSEEEIAELCGVVAECGGLYATHTRNQAGEDQETIAEAIRTAQTAGVALQISHISVVARRAADGVRAVDGALEQVDRARRAGLDVDFDMHTRLFGTTNLSAALPPEVLEGDQAAVAARLRDPEVRRRVGAYRSIVAGLAQGDWQRILLSQYGPRPELAGQSLADIGRDMGLEPVDLICELLLAAQDRVHEPMILAFCYREDEVRRVFAHPRCMVGSDATALCPDGPLQGLSSTGPIPGRAGFSGTLCAIRVFCPRRRPSTVSPGCRPAAWVWKDRGTIRPGAWADLAVFDGQTFRERGTVAAPNLTARGMVHVLVNGVPTLEDGAWTGARGGQVLRRGG